MYIYICRYTDRYLDIWKKIWITDVYIYYTWNTLLTHTDRQLDRQKDKK